jgi:hypothetical protein
MNRREVLHTGASLSLVTVAGLGASAPTRAEATQHEHHGAGTHAALAASAAHCVTSKACEEEFRNHEARHSVCKDCADSCAACAKECQKAAA